MLVVKTTFYICLIYRTVNCPFSKTKPAAKNNWPVSDDVRKMSELAKNDAYKASGRHNNIKDIYAIGDEVVILLDSQNSKQWQSRCY